VKGKWYYPNGVQISKDGNIMNSLFTKIFSAPAVFIVLLLIVDFSHPLAASKDQAEAQLFQAEQEYQLQNALDISKQIKEPGEELSRHITHLSETARVVELADIYQQNQKPEKALELLNTQLTLLVKDGSSMDKHLVSALLNQILRIQAPAANANKADVKASFDLARTLRDAKNFDAAISLLTEAAKKFSANSNSPLKQQVEAELRATKREKAISEQPEFIKGIHTTITEGGSKLLETLLYIIIGFVLFLLARYIWRHRCIKDATEIVLQDLTSANNNILEGNSALSQALEETLGKLINGGDECADVGGIMDLDSSSLPSAPAPRGFDAFAAHIDTTAVAIGPFSLTPRQLFTYLTYLFTCRYASSLTGSLIKENEEYVLHIEQRSIHAIVQGDNIFIARSKSRSDVLEQMATQLLVSLAQQKITDDWRSLHAYRQAEQLLTKELSIDSTNERTDNLKKAKKTLQTALLIDPANWLARYRLATVQRTLGDNITAKQQFDYVGSMLCSSEILDNRYLRRYVEQSPIFPLLVLHNRAVCEAKQGSAEAREGKTRSTLAAISTFSYLATKIQKITKSEKIISACQSVLNDGPDLDVNIVPSDVKKLIKRFIALFYIKNHAQPSDTDLNRLIMLIRAARTAALGDLLEYHVRMQRYNLKYTKDAKNVYQSDTIFKWIVDNEDWFYDKRYTLESKNWTTYALAHATTQNTRGRACYLMRKWNDARNYLSWATEYHIPANFPDPYINLAALYLKKTTYLAKDWISRTEELLTKALELSPLSKKARYLLGKLYYLQRDIDTEYEKKALEQFKLAGNDSWSLYRAADILLSRQETALAMQKLKLSVELADVVDWRYRYYVSTILELADTNAATLEELREARYAARDLEKEGFSKRLRKFGADASVSLAKHIKDAETP
jgi:hypothetical protein